MFPTNGLKVKKEENKNVNKTIPILRKEAKYGREA